MKTIVDASIFIKVLWAIIVVVLMVALFNMDWTVVFIAVLTGGLIYYVSHVDQHYDVHIPKPIIVALVGFLFASLFLGEVFDFYERFWFWDVLLHSISAIGFALIAGIRSTSENSLMFCIVA